MERTMLIVDDHVGVTTALTHLAAADGWTDVRVEHTLDGARAAVDRHRPHLASIDLTLGDDNGLALVRHLARQHPDVAVVVLTGSGTVENAVASLRSGARAFIPKSVAPSDLMAAIAAAERGERWLPPSLLGPVLDHLMDPPPPDEWAVLVGELSPREHEVLALMVTGLDRRQIAARLTISLDTVRTHVKNILAKLGVHSSLEAVSIGLRAGMHPDRPDRRADPAG